MKTANRAGNRVPMSPGKLAGAICLVTCLALPAAAELPGMGLDPVPYSTVVEDPVTYQNSTLPPSYDLRAEGLVTPAKHQSGCGSCWAFAGMACVETACILAGARSDIDFAEQYLVSCDPENNGCRGGNATAFDFLMSGIVVESDLPYGSGDANGNGNALIPCPENLNTCGWRVSDWDYLNDGSVPPVQDLKRALIDYGAIWLGFIVYDDFVDGHGGGYWFRGDPLTPYVHPVGTGTRVGAHVVQLIGYDDTQRCWIAKNSWGETGGPAGDGTFCVAYDSGCHFGLNAAWVTAERFGGLTAVVETTWGALKERFRSNR